ncbi:hypothetical protein B0H11DRAFT_2234671 [Mycena galericulata]|nr:hypothetical protein B0H11DRAFT_2234671 [Mycena galericulata]
MGSLLQRSTGKFDEEKVLAKTGQEIERILEQLEKQRAELMNWKARRWEKLRKLHWGPCAVVMYYNQYKTLESSIEKFEMDAVLQNFMMDAERSAYKCGAQLPTNDPMPV